MDNKANIIEIFDGYLEASLILDKEVATEVVVEILSRNISFEETDSSEIASILTNEDVILIEKIYSESYGEAYFIEGLIYDNEQSDVENNVVFIQDTVLDEIDTEFIYSDEIYTFSYFDEDKDTVDWQEEVNDICNGNCEECDCNDEYDEEVENLLDGLVEDFMEQLEYDYENFEELLKGYLMEAFDYGEEYGAETIISDLQNKYDL